MQALRDAVHVVGRTLARNWRPHLRKRGYLPSAANLAAYIALRRHDLRPIQGHLTQFGLSPSAAARGM